MSVATGLSMTSYVTVIILTLSFSDACFIRNCPKGGKRSMEEITVPRHECTKCGPDGTGQCVGPSICCGQDFGCLMGTLHTSVCKQENLSATPCLVRGEVCGAQDNGNCVADGICCDSESCAMNKRCNKPLDMALESQTNRHEVIQLLHNLLRERDYD